MADATIRIGIVGAGANTRLRHIPGFRAIDGVEIHGVVNRTKQSTQRAAADLSIPRAFPDWQTLVADDEIDAVMVGTWPNLHCEVTCAALAAGKHVLTEARMARNLEEAQRMLAAAMAHPQLTTQIVPSPLGLECGAAVRQLIDDGLLGQLRELVVIGANDSFWDDSQPVHWRQQSRLSGKNILMLGIMHETVQRWCPDPTSVFSQAAVFSNRASDDPPAQVDLPDSLQILTELEGGARGLYHLSGIALHGPPPQIHMYGSRGTIKVEFGEHARSGSGPLAAARCNHAAEEERVLLGRVGESDPQEFSIPDPSRGRWRVEEEFISAIRGREEVTLTDFRSGVRYMQFTEAVSRSIESRAPSLLPLRE